MSIFCRFLLEKNKSVTVQVGTTPVAQKNEFLGVGKNFRLLMQSCCFFCRFFFSRPFHENFKFLKNCPYDFHEILHSHSTPKGAPAYAKASKSYGLDVRNIAKISPKVAKKQPFFDFFRFSQKLSIRFERKRVRRKDLSRLLYRICGSGLNMLSCYFSQCRNISNQGPISLMQVL